MKRHHLIYALLLLLIQTATAQVTFFNYTDPNQILATEEDGDYFWAGTNGGLYKWFKSGGGLIGKYHNQNGLPSNLVHTIKKDHFYNQLWIGTDEGVAVLNVLNQWTVYTTADGLAGNVVKSIAFDLSGNKWFATYNGVTKFNPAQNTWTTYTTSNGLINNFVEAIDVDYQGNVWAGTLAGVSVFDGTSWTNYTTSNGLIHNRITAIATDDTKGNVWIGTTGGVSLFNGYIWKPYTQDSGLISNSITSIAVDAQSNVWFGTSFGVSKFDGDTTWINFTVADGLASNLINVVNIDAEGNKWFGNYNGVTKLSHNGSTWTSYITGEGIIDNRIQAITEDKNNNLWFATQEGVSKFDRKHWTPFIGTVTDGLASNFVYSVFADTAGNKWFGTEKGLTYLMNDTTWINYNKDSGMLNNEVLSVISDRNGNIWCASDSGLSVFNGSTWQWYTSDSGLSNSFVHDIAMDTAGYLWFATDSGVTVFNGTTWTRYYTSNGLADNRVFTIAVDESNIKWFGTYNGLTKLSGTTWSSYTTSNGLADNWIQDIAFDHTGNTWIATAWGLSKYNGSVFINYTDAEGLTHNDVKTVFIDDDNIVWAGTTGGVSRLACKNPGVQFTADTACLPGLTSLTNTSTNVDNATIYQWDIGNNGSIDYTTKNVSHNFMLPGIYPVQLIATNMGCTDSLTLNIVVRIRPDAGITQNGSTTFCNGSNILLTAIVNNRYAGADYKYKWTTGNTDSTLSVTMGGKYLLTVTDGNCKSYPDSIIITVIYPYSGETICMVTNDSNSGKNLVVWERTSGKAIESYNIYKLIGNQYSIIGNVPFSDISVFEDLNSFPDVKAERYAITVIDTCGSESDYSPYHQTIHLGASKGLLPNEVVLDWTEYKDESSAFNPVWYYIYRGTNPNNLTVVDSLSSLIGTEWNDVNSVGSLYYRIAVKKPGICTPTALHKANSGPFSQAISNLEDNRLRDSRIDEINNSLAVALFPNPANNYVTINFSADAPRTIELKNILGKIIRIIKTTENTITIDLQNIPPCVLLITIHEGIISDTRMIIKQ